MAGKTDFTIEILQALNDWQRGGDHKQKIRRGARLKKSIASLPVRFRTCQVVCYRQEAHSQGRTAQLLLDRQLPETITGWTTDLTIAKQFKGGIPPVGL